MPHKDNPREIAERTRKIREARLKRERGMHVGTGLSNAELDRLFPKRKEARRG